MGENTTVKDYFIRFAWVGASMTVVVYGIDVCGVYGARSALSEQARSRALKACDETDHPGTCRSEVEQLHGDCFRWSLTSHGADPDYDAQKYRRCLRHPPGKFRD